jgi:pimeloyl-ACP methyl ester carboxylesterase
MTAAVPDPAVPPIEPCPTPLAWQEVLREVTSSGSPIVCREADYELTGRVFGEGPTLVFLPTASGTGVLSSLTAWLLREQYRCVLLDNVRVHSPVSPRRCLSMTLEAWNQWATQDGSREFWIYASGSSVRPAVQWTQELGSKVAGLIVQGGGVDKRLTWSEWLLLQWARWLRRPLRGVPAWISVQAQNHRRWFPPFDQSRFDFLMQELAGQPCRDVAQRLLAETLPLENFASSPVPALFIYCEGDGPLLTRELQQLQSHFLRAQQAELHSAGMFPYLTHPHRLVKVLRGFLESARGPQASAQAAE